MSINYILQFVFIGLSMGAIYAIIALGYTTIFRASNIVNFAQGEFVMLGGLFTHFFMVSCGFSYLFSGVLAVIFVILVGIGLQLLIIHPVRKAGVLISIMATLGASMVISNVPVPLSSIPNLGYLSDPFTLPKLTATFEAIEIAGARISSQRLWVICISLVLLGILYYFSNYTRTGKAMEASASSPLAAQLAGIRIEKMVLYAFAISAAIGAIGGILITPIFNMRYDSGMMLGLKGFVACVLGGWGKTSGAVLGGFMLGIIESLCVGLIPLFGSLYQQMWAFIILIAILYFRPMGILGGEVEE